ncbi:TonB-dependent siderophore myxochelin receptor MxcH [Sorangium sp. So ce136]|uniref:TonB-dependent siderophore myxochelin receptor MxcH n=1 Tax=Sorangium sp. So ce136 TaxID=3133284 RepID=UPI003F036823
MNRGRCPRRAGLVWILALLPCGARPAFAQEARTSQEAPVERPFEQREERPTKEAESGQGARAPGDGAAIEVRAPELIERAEAAYPEAARGAGMEGSVVLTLTIDAEGRVTRANVATPAGHGFDEAAQEAALRFRFTPARRGDRSVAARILYRYDFRLPEPPAAATPAAGSLAAATPAAATPATAAVAGRLLWSGPGGEPVAGVEIAVASPDGGSRRVARTDEQGRFRVEALAPGPYEVTAAPAFAQRLRGRVAAAAGREAETTLRLVPLAAAPSLEVSVRGASEAERLRRSAEAVQVVETAAARRQSADLGEVLARSEGVSVRRGGGLGSAARFSLNGLTGEQIRFFLDGVPLALSGYASGIAAVPVNLVERVEIYRGVVPVRFGADALGGAVNLVSDRDTRGTRASASYQVGSFGTYRLTLGARHAHEPSGLFARASGFVDHARNDYPMQDVEVLDDSGRVTRAEVRRFHDRYRAAGGSVEAGWIRRPWAERLVLRAFYAAHDRDVQHNLFMTVPYGEVTYGRQSGGGHVRYEQPLHGRRLRLDAVAGYALARTAFRDMATCRYDWRGRCVATLPQPGEMGDAADQAVLQHTAYASVNLAFRVAPGHLVRLGVSPTYASRTGRNRAIRDGYDPLTAQRGLLGGVAGVEYEARPLDGRLANITFLKSYAQVIGTKEVLPSGALRDLDLTRHRLGIGDSLRLRFTEALYAKASYELATRLPSAEELFGDGGVITDSLHLRPEVSHNVNAGVTLERAETGFGQVRFDVNGFGRLVEDLIRLGGQASYAKYENFPSARSLGFESSVGWTSPGDWLALDGQLTWQDFRNTTSAGPLSRFEGDRMLNQPYLFADASARLQWPEPFHRRDALTLTWSTRYVAEFFLGWESAGDAKHTVEPQLLHALALAYAVQSGGRSVSGSLEVHNLTDQKAFDFYGVQRPGRAAYAKLVLEL